MGAERDTFRHCFCLNLKTVHSILIGSRGVGVLLLDRDRHTLRGDGIAGLAVGRRLEGRLGHVVGHELSELHHHVVELEDRLFRRRNERVPYRGTQPGRRTT